jgi:hypothetical protein
VDSKNKEEILGDREETSEVNSILLNSDSHFSRNPNANDSKSFPGQSKNILESQDYNDNFHSSSVQGKLFFISKWLGNELEIENDPKESLTRKDGKEMANLISEKLSCGSSKRISSSLAQNQKREITKLNQKILQYQNFLFNRDLIIKELEKELKQ